MIQDEIMKLQTYKMFEGEDTVYVERDDVLEVLKQEPCEDCISRQAVNVLVEELARAISDERCFTPRGRSTASIMQDILELPPVTPKPKTGHWIDIMVEDMPAQVCDQCRRFYPLSCTGGGYNYCPSCGSRMIEPQESEE